jgi:deoxycytidine triphosphate deaminase
VILSDRTLREQQAPPTHRHRAARDETCIQPSSIDVKGRQSVPRLPQPLLLGSSMSNRIWKSGQRAMVSIDMSVFMLRRRNRAGFGSLERIAVPDDGEASRSKVD